MDRPQCRGVEPVDGAGDSAAYDARSDDPAIDAFQVLIGHAREIDRVGLFMPGVVPSVNTLRIPIDAIDAPAVYPGRGPTAG